MNTKRFIRKYVSDRSIHKKKKELAIRLSYISLEGIKFRNQYFKKEDFLSLRSDESADREVLHDRLNQLITTLQAENKKLPKSVKITFHKNSVDVVFSHDDNGYSQSIISLSPIDITLTTVFGGGQKYFQQRQQLHFSLTQEPFTQSLFQTLKSLPAEYSIDVAGVSKSLGTIANEKLLTEHIQNDYGFYFPIVITKTFAPDNAGLASEKIAGTFNKEFTSMEPIIANLRGTNS